MSINPKFIVCSVILLHEKAYQNTKKYTSIILLPRKRLERKDVRMYLWNNDFILTEYEPLIQFAIVTLI